VYRTRDGWIAVSLAPVSQLARVTESDALAAFRDDERFARREEISAALGRELAARTSQEWLDLFRSAGIWCAPVAGYAQVVNDPQVRWNESFLEFDHPRAGRVRLLGHPIRYDGRPLPLRRRPPLLGEDTDEILRGLDYTPAEIAAFRTHGVV
jgi:crotonobetainyl-CoA:carnitine CoA-transferase CaiB-like acyl-CoA transferase